MKRIFALVCISLMMLVPFVGCGAVEDTVDNAETMMSDAMDKASEMMTSDKSQENDGDADNGKVTDGDGFIEEGNNNSNTKSTSGNSSYGNKNNTSSTGATENTTMQNNTNGSIV